MNGIALKKRNEETQKCSKHRKIPSFQGFPLSSTAHRHVAKCCLTNNAEIVKGSSNPQKSKTSDMLVRKKSVSPSNCHTID